MEKLSQIAVCYKTLEELLQMLEFGVESDLKRCGDKQYTAEAVTLMTLHGSKGLEFPAVLLYGAEKAEFHWKVNTTRRTGKKRGGFYM